MGQFFGEVFLALKSYLYGCGWLVIALVGTAQGLRYLQRYSPVNVKAELERGNMAVALVLGLFLFGLVFGILYLAAHLS